MEAEDDAHSSCATCSDGREVGMLTLGDDDAYEAARRSLEEAG